MRAFFDGIITSFPIMIGYLPVAMVFGISAAGAGMSIEESVFISALIFAGASQFALISIISAGNNIAVATITALALNFRHLIYGPAVASFLKRRPKPTHVLPIAFGLTDEVFATAIAKLNRVDKDMQVYWLLGLETGAYVAWVGGTFIGAVGGDVLISIIPNFAPILYFALPALFMALLLPLLRGDATVSAIFGAAIALVMYYLGFTAFGILIAGIAAPMLTLCVRDIPRLFKQFAEPRRSATSTAARRDSDEE